MLHRVLQVVLSMFLVGGAAVVHAQDVGGGEARPSGLRSVRTIVIDPGHGGEDPGSVGVTGIPEKAYTLAVSLLLRDELARRFPALRVVMTREDDSYPTLEQRTHAANLAEADLLLSVHFNCAENPEAHGIETFFIAPEGTAPTKEDAHADHGHSHGVAGDRTAMIVSDLRAAGAMQDSARLAELFQASLVASTGARDRSVRQAKFRVLRGARMPAIVLELGFLSNPAEGARIATPEYAQRLVDGLIDGLESWDLWDARVARDRARQQERWHATRRRDGEDDAAVASGASNR